MSEQKYGFVYIWLDNKHKRYYVGCHWGFENDGYICSSSWMKKAYRIRPEDFKRRIIRTRIPTRLELYEEEQRWLNLIKPSEIKPYNSNPRYYNLCITNNNIWHKYDENIKTVGQKISAANKGKKFGKRDPSVGKAISSVKLAKRPEVNNQLMIEMFKAGKSLPEVVAHFGTHSRHIRELVKELGYTSINEIKPKREIKQPMSRAEQNKLCSQQLKRRWTDPEWAANQKLRLSEGAKKRPPRSEESKQKVRDAQLGKPKPRKNKIHK